MRKSSIFLVFMAAGISLSILAGIHAANVRNAMMASLREKAILTRHLGLADLCLFTEASYTRHLSQADLSTPFQDSPMSLEHFPSGSLVGPPAMVRRMNGKMD